MEEKNFQTIVADTLREVLEKAGVEDISVEIRSGRPGMNETFVCAASVSRSDSKILIGQHGVTLSALQHLIQTLAKQRSQHYEGFSIDINNYWKEKQRLLRQDAEEAAHAAISTGRPVNMRPMYSYERKIVHMILSDNDRVETESFGKGEERRIMVKPASLV